MLLSKNLNQNKLLFFEMRYFLKKCVIFWKKSPSSGGSALRLPQFYPHQLYCYKTL